MQQPLLPLHSPKCLPSTRTWLRQRHCKCLSNENLFQTWRNFNDQKEKKYAPPGNRVRAKCSFSVAYDAEKLGKPIYVFITCEPPSGTGKPGVFFVCLFRLSHWPMLLRLRHFVKTRRALGRDFRPARARRISPDFRTAPSMAGKVECVCVFFSISLSLPLLYLPILESFPCA